MNLKSSEQALLEVEKSGLPTQDLLKQVTQILRVDLQNYYDEFCKGRSDLTGRKNKSFAPKEEWALRWLLKRLRSNDPANVTASGKPLLEDDRIWLLMLYLVSSLPSQTVSRILQERDFFSGLPIWLSALSTTKSERNHGSTVSMSSVQVNGHRDDPPRKRRKLSNDTTPQYDVKSQPEPKHIGNSCSLIACQVLAELARDQSSASCGTHHDQSFFWQAMTAQDAGRALGTAFELLTDLWESNPTSSGREEVCNLTMKALLMWTTSGTQGDAISTGDRSKPFHENCTRSSINLLQLLKTQNHNPLASAAARQIERLISLNCIIPLRSRLNEVRKHDWRFDRVALEWSGVEKLLEITAEWAKNTGIATQSVEAFPTLFDLAVRSMPAHNSRKWQNERWWLEAFFLGLMYVAYPNLPRMEHRPDGVLQKMDVVVSEQQQTSIEPLDRLLDSASRHGLAFSLPALSYVTSAILELDRRPSLWATLGKLIQLDSDILIPNSGLTNTGYCLDQICRRIADDVDDDDEGGFRDLSAYELVRDQIIIPLVGAFSKSRDPLGFIKLWWQGLQDAMHQQILIEDEETVPRPILAWLDTDVFTEVSKAVRGPGQPSLTKDLCQRALASLQGLDTMTGSITNVLADVAILDCVLNARPEDAAAANLDMKELGRVIISALKTNNTYQYQRWRLWSLLRRYVQAMSAETDQDLYSFLSEKVHASLQMVPQIMSLPNPIKRAAGLRECLESFHLLVTSVCEFSSTANFVETLREELLTLLSLLRSGDRHKHNASEYFADLVWDRKSRCWNGRLHLIDGCIGILLQNGKCFSNFPAWTPDLVGALIFATHTIPVARESEALLELALAVCTADEVSRDRQLSQNCIEAFLEGLDPESHASFACSLALNRIDLTNAPKAQLDRIGDKFARFLEKSVALNGDSRENEQSHCTLAILETVASRSRYSVFRPQNWDRLAELCHAIESYSRKSGWKSHLQAVQYLERLFTAFWGRLLQLDLNEPSQNMLNAILDWTNSHLPWPPIEVPPKPPPVFLVQFLTHYLRSRNDKLLQSHAARAESLLRQTVRHLCLFTSDLENGHLKLKETLEVTSLFVQCTEALGCNGDNSSILKFLVLLKDRLVDSVIAKDAKEVDVLRSEYFRIVGAIDGQLQSLGHGNDSSNRLDSDQYKAILRKSLEMECFTSNECMTNARLSECAQAIAAALGQIPTDQFGHLAPVVRDQANSLGAAFAEALFVGAVTQRVDASSLQTMPELLLQLRTYASLTEMQPDQGYENLCVLLELSRSIVLRHPRILNQAAVDDLLTSTSTIASHGFSQAKDAASTCEIATAIFGRLCDLLGIVLGQFRRRLNARHHLLLAALQSLLRCLYYPGSTAVAARLNQTQPQLKFLSTLPHWLLASPEPLPATSATKFARLLNTLCSPSPSAVKPSKRNQPQNASSDPNLTDATKKARSLAGQYMQYLVMTWARCVLDGQPGSPQTRQKLMPGLYAVLDCMPTELMRAMNECMDPSSRSIWKGLYEDWTRFGKWDRR